MKALLATSFAVLLLGSVRADDVVQNVDADTIEAYKKIGGDYYGVDE